MQTNPGLRLQQLASLSIADWGILFGSMLLLPATAFALRLKGFTWTLEYPEWRTKKKQNVQTDKADQLNDAHRVARLVSIAANHGVYRANCLKKALVTRWLLQNKGINTDLRIGVNGSSGTFSAHAWLEYNGHTLIDAADVKQRFAAFELY